MKLFNTVQELWSYCAFCPLCEDICRDVIVDVAMDSDFNIETSFEKKDQFLHITCERRLWRSRPIDKKKNRTHETVCKYVIDCTKNTFTLLSQPDTPEQASCYIQSMCESCANTFTYGADMELYAHSQKVFNIGLERESIELSDDTHRYELNYYYSNDTPPGVGMFVYRSLLDAEGDPDNLGIKLPLMELDFYDPKKVINKLKTLILFS